MTQETESLITDAMRASVGREGAPITLEVDKTGVRMFARAVQHVDQIFYDEAYARSRGHRSIVAPPGYFGTPAYNPAADPGTIPENRLAPDGRTLRTLNGGTELEFTGVDVCAGDTITAVSKVVSLSQRDSSLGPIIVSRRETTYTNQLGEVVGRLYGTTLMY